VPALLPSTLVIFALVLLFLAVVPVVADDFWFPDGALESVPEDATELVLSVKEVG
jgi:hypothetical protein